MIGKGPVGAKVARKGKEIIFTVCLLHINIHKASATINAVLQGVNSVGGEAHNLPVAFKPAFGGTQTYQRPVGVAVAACKCEG